MAFFVLYIYEATLFFPASSATWPLTHRITDPPQLGDSTAVHRHAGSLPRHQLFTGIFLSACRSAAKPENTLLHTVNHTKGKEGERERKCGCKKEVAPHPRRCSLRWATRGRGC